MTETKFTPAPWGLHNAASLVVVGGKYESSIASCGGSNELSLEEQQANAHLIAAAPEMYKELDEIRQELYAIDSILERVAPFVTSVDGRIKSIEMLLAQARGENV